MTDAERLKVAQEVLEGLQWDHEYDNCPGCDGESHTGHEKGCKWMIAMGLADE